MVKKLHQRKNSHHYTVCFLVYSFDIHPPKYHVNINSDYSFPPPKTINDQFPFRISEFRDDYISVRLAQIKTFYKEISN